MKKPMTSKQVSVFTELIISQENVIKETFDEMVLLESLIKPSGSIKTEILGRNIQTAVLSIGKGLTPKNQARLIRECLLRFPIKKCYRRVIMWNEYYLLISHISLAVFHSENLTKVMRGSNDDLILRSIQKMRTCLELSLDIIIELKQKNGIN